MSGPMQAVGGTEPGEISVRLDNIDVRLDKVVSDMQQLNRRLTRLNAILALRYLLAFGTAFITTILAAIVAIIHLRYAVKEPSGQSLWFFLASESILVLLTGMLLWSCIASNQND